MKELVRSLILFAVLASTICVSAAVEVSPPLSMAEKHPTIARNVTKLIEEMHYSRPTLDNSLSSAVLDGYLDTLDGNRLYFLASDVASFGRYRYEFDDRTRSGALEPVPPSSSCFSSTSKRHAGRTTRAHGFPGGWRREFSAGSPATQARPAPGTRSRESRRRRGATPR